MSKAGSALSHELTVRTSIIVCRLWTPLWADVGSPSRIRTYDLAVNSRAS